MSADHRRIAVVAGAEPTDHRVRSEAQRRFNDRVQDEMQGTVWTAGGCASWYLDASGRNSTLWPGFTWRFKRMTERFDAASYVTENGAAPAADRVEGTAEPVP